MAENAVPEAAAVAAATGSVPVVQAPSAEGLVSLDFQDADIRSVLKVLSYKSGVNIVPGPDVTGIVTIQLTDVPWQKALDVILSTYGYGYDRKGNIIMVTSIENLKKHREDTRALEEQEPLVTKTYALNFAKASDVVDSLGKMKTPRGTINFDQRTNILIVRDTQSALELMDGVVRSLDAVTPQVLIEAQIIETDLSNTENLGIDWTVAATASGAQHGTPFPFLNNNKFIPPTAAGGTNNSFNYGTLSFSAFQAVLQILKTRTDTNIISSPKVVTLDNQTAKIVVGTQYPIPNYTYNTEQAKLQVSGFEYKNIGVIFEVTPHVNGPGLVTLDLHPTISANDGTVTFDSQNTLPLLTIQEASTKVMIESGQTLVIAGLITDSVIITNKKVPLIGDIPLVGEAFKNKQNTKSKKELLIFLTPHIITAKDPAASPASGAK